MDMTNTKYLQWRELALSSDAITNSYRGNTRMAAIIGEVNADAEELYRAGSTIGAYIIFPSYQIDRKNTINQARGINAKIADRFDLTLECIRRHYIFEKSPLADVLQRYNAFFELFINFDGYVNFFLLQDLVTADNQVDFFLPFDGFIRKGIPANAEEYLKLKDATIKFIQSRAQRMQASLSTDSDTMPDS
nr:hypothetical protein [Parahaliea maris]